MRTTSTRTLTIAVALGLAGTLVSPKALAAAGKVLLVSGVAKVQGATERDLQKGDEIAVGDVISTDQGSRVQLLMADGARIVLQPASSVRIDEFAMPSAVRSPSGTGGGDSAAGKSVATLLSGRIDASAGAIGAITFRTHGDPITLTRDPHPTLVPAGSDVSAFVSLDAGDGLVAPPGLEDAEQPPQLSRAGHTRFGLGVNLLEAQLPMLPQISAAVSVPTSGGSAFVSSTTERSDAYYLGSGGSVVQLNAMFGSGSSAEQATYLSGSAALLDFGSNGSSGIHWGRWAAGSASVSTRDGRDDVDLRNASLHWITGPVFEAQPILPTAGSINFRLAGGTSPTDTLGHVGALNSAVLSADFTAQIVRAQLSLDVNGYNWFATGSGPLTPNTVRFGGTFGTVLVDGRVSGTGEFTGFLSAGPLTRDQLNGAGLSYWLNASQGALGVVSGVAAFVPGSPVPLTPPLVQRDVAYATGTLGTVMLASGAGTNSRGDLATDASGNLTRFRAPLAQVSGSTFAVGTSTITSTGVDAATGIRWGRWDGGTITVTASSTPPRSEDLASESLHWLASGEFGAPPTLPQARTANYTLGGHSDPTDTSGHTGVLGVASFNADFTNRFIDSRLTLNLDGRAWYASGEATYPIGGQRFCGNYPAVRIDNLARGHGTLDGFFTQARVGSAVTDGAGLAFNLADNAGELGVVSGVLAFAKGGAGAVIDPLPTQKRDIAMLSPDFATGGTVVGRASAGSYDLDSDLGLVAMPGVANTATANNARYLIGSSTKVESDVSPLVMLRWGRWAGGSAVVNNWVSGSLDNVDLSQRSLHWIEGADSAAPPVIPQSGTALYALIGATTPTDRAGHTGVLNSASLNADFTHQTVDASFDVTINHVNVVGNGTGSIGSNAGLAAHQFSGTITGGVASSTGSAPQGSFSGFFSGAGSNPSAAPSGAGLTYTMTDGTGGLTVDGAAALRKQ
jgi:hypothetical protein